MNSPNEILTCHVGGKIEAISTLLYKVNSQRTYICAEHLYLSCITVLGYY